MIRPHISTVLKWLILWLYVSHYFHWPTQISKDCKDVTLWFLQINKKTVHLFENWISLSLHPAFALYVSLTILQTWPTYVQLPIRVKFPLEGYLFGDWAPLKHNCCLSLPHMFICEIKERGELVKLWGQPFRLPLSPCTWDCGRWAKLSTLLENW